MVAITAAVNTETSQCVSVLGALNCLPKSKIS